MEKTDLTPTPTVTPEVTPVTPVKTETAVTPTVTPEVTPVTPAVDVDAIKKDLESSVSDSVSKSVLQKLGDALGLNKKQEEQLPKDPKELLAYIKEESRRQAEDIINAREKASKDQQTQTEQEKQKQLQDGAKNFQETWNRDFTEMSTLGMVPKIVDANNQNDPGRLAKTKILLKLKEVIDENEKNGIDHVPSLWEIMSRFPNVFKTNTVAGANTPVSGGGNSGAGMGNNQYSQLHHTSIEEMLAAKTNA